MARVKGAMMTRKHRKKILGLAKGYWGNKSRHYKMANQQMMKSGRYAYVGRKQKKRDFRQLWITRISAGCKANGMNYSTFMHGDVYKRQVRPCASPSRTRSRSFSMPPLSSTAMRTATPSPWRRRLRALPRP